ncbi:hypothetical protein BJ742DRAFT_739445 [Cladochytrium replicatum]|nr:hypothetical protein BJ742DRAFT_739445 [Cladochytrium replicatum]
MTWSLNQKELFGGAIRTVVPSSFVDISTLRDVPDNQEVFADTQTNQSLIFELVEMTPDVSDESAAVHHFAMLAQDNDARASEIFHVEHLKPEDLVNLTNVSSATIVVGQQAVAKFRESGPDAVNQITIYLACIRLPSVQTDIIISYNQPVALGEASSERLSGANAMGTANEAVENFRQVVTHLSVMDWSLFG